MRRWFSRILEGEEEEENTKKIEQFSRANISWTLSEINVKFGMQGEVYEEHNICEFGKIGSVVFKIQEVEIGEILVCVNNTLVLCATFLAAQHTTVYLNRQKTIFLDSLLPV